VFMNFASIYEAHGAFTAAITPPLVVTLLLAVFWRRFTATAAIWTIVGGLVAMAFSLFVPQVIAPFAQGVPAGDGGEGFFGGISQYKYMRACYGLSVCAIIAVVVTLFTRPETTERQRGLVWGTIADALRRYKGSDGEEGKVVKVRAMPGQAGSEHPPGTRGEAGLPVVWPSRALANELGGAPGDLVYITDARWWLGGLRSAHAILGEIEEDVGATVVKMDDNVFETVVARGRREKPVVVERLY